MQSTAKEIAKNLNELGDKIAIVIDGEEFSYDYLRSRVSALSKIILRKSKHQERIGLQLQDNIDCYVGLVSLLLTGRTFVPVNEGFGMTQNTFMLETGEIEKVIQSADTGFLRDLKQKKNFEIISSKEEDGDRVQVVESEQAYLLFTSGSTGNPKGVPISHENLDQFIQGIIKDEDWELDSSDRFLQPFNLSFDLFVFTVYLPLTLGATFLTVPLNRIAIYSAAHLKEENITVSLLVPSTMKIINKLSSSLTFDSLRLSFFCGEALYASDLKDWMKSTPNAKQINIYGPTEATVAFTKYVWNENSNEEVRNDIVPIGVPFGNNILGLLKDENGNELLLGGPQVFSKYVGTDKDPFIERDNIRFYRTGDICEINSRGNYLFIGRNDGQVKVDGYRIEISDVENKLKKVFPERQIVVVHKTNSEKLCSLHAFISGDKIDDIQLKVEQSVPDYMRPSSFNFIDAIPLNMNGKTDRKKLKTLI